MIRRRDFITLLVGGAAAAWPVAARGQQSAKMRTIGFLGNATFSAWRGWVVAFVQRLNELGWIEGRNVAIEYRWAEGRPERYVEIAAEFLRLNVDVIITTGPSVLTVKQATSIIPIVFATANDPVGTGMVASLARPGGNVTGTSVQNTETASKRVELLREFVPGLRRLAILANSGYPAAALEMGEVLTAAKALGLEVATLEIRRAEDVGPVFERIKGKAEALHICTDSLVYANWSRINNLALDARLPTMNGAREYVDAGGFVSYGPNFPNLWRRAAELVDKILRGTKPGDIPIEQPTKFDLIINVKTAKLLGLDVPPMLLARADEVIE